MSTLKVDTIQNVAGGSASTPLQLEQGRAKAWVNFNGTGVVAIRDSYNCSSVVDNGVGDYTINFATALNNANYSFSGAYSNNVGVVASGGLNVAGSAAGSPPTTTAFRFTTSGAYTSASYDPTYVSVVIFGDQ